MTNMLKKMMLATFGVLAFALSPASANGPANACTYKCEKLPENLTANGATHDIDWVTLPNVTQTYQCWAEGRVRQQGVVEGPCLGMYVQCRHYDGQRQCRFRGLVQVVHQSTVEERSPRVEERPIIERPVVRQREVIREVPVVRERRVVRHRHVERDRGDSGGSWRPISHRSTMNCWGRGSVPTGKTVYGQCNGRYTQCVGGSLSSGAHRQCSAKF